MTQISTTASVKRLTLTQRVNAQEAKLDQILAFLQGGTAVQPAEETVVTPHKSRQAAPTAPVRPRDREGYAFKRSFVARPREVSLLTKVGQQTKTSINTWEFAGLEGTSKRYKVRIGGNGIDAGKQYLVKVGVVKGKGLTGIVIHPL